MIKTAPAFPLVLCLSTLRLPSPRAPLPHQRSELAAREGSGQVRGPRLLGWSPPLIGLTACHSNWLPLQLTIHVVQFGLGVFNVANNERYFFWGGGGGKEARRVQVVLQLVH